MDTSKIKKLQRQIKNINKKALRAGVKVILGDVRSKAPFDTGALKQSLASKVDSFKGEVTAYGLVGPRSKYIKKVKGQNKQPSRYFHFIEKGRFAKPFLAPTFQANKTQYLEAVKKVLAVEMQKVIND